MNRLLGTLPLLIALSAPAGAQQVQQSGKVTPGHLPVWVTTGVIKDAGTATTPDGITSIGVTNNGGPGICIITAPITSTSAKQMCFSVNSTGGVISVQKYGTGAASGLSFVIDGVLAGFPVVLAPHTAGNVACFANSSGNLSDCTFNPPTNGTPGGIPYWINAATAGSSAALTQYGVVLGGGVSGGTGGAPTSTAAMTNGQLLVGQTGSAPLPKTVTGDVTLGATGAASVTHIGGVPVTATGAATNDVWYYNGTTWIHNALISLLNTICTASPSTCAAFFGYYNVIWYGADPTFANPSKTAINNAIAAACPNNGVVFVPLGNYDISGGLNIDNYTGGHVAGGCTIQGAGQTGTVLQSKSGSTNALLEILGTSALTVRDLWVRATQGTTVAYGALIAASTTLPCNVIKFENVTIDGYWSTAGVYNQNCTDELYIHSTMASYNPAAVFDFAITSTNPFGAQGTYANISTVSPAQSGGITFVDYQIHDLSVNSGASSVIPLWIQGGNAPINYYGGIVAGSTDAAHGGLVTFGSGSGAITGASFIGTNFYADNGTPPDYVFFPNQSVTGLVVQNTALNATSAAFAVVTGSTYTSLNVSGNSILPTNLFAPLAANNSTIISSFIDAAGKAISVGSSGLLKFNSIINPGTITAANSIKPTVQSFLTGGASGTYTTPAGVSWLKYKIVGAGGGSAGSGTTGATNGTAGGDTTFGPSTAHGGGAPSAAGFATGGVGGTASLGSGPIGLAVVQGGGGVASFLGSTSIYPPTGAGGSSCLGGGGVGGGANSSGTAGAANTGGGGGGTGANAVGSSISGASGGAGGCVEAIINTPAATYSYAVGDVGAAGLAGTSGNAGATGGTGGIWVEEHYGPP